MLMLLIASRLTVCDARLICSVFYLAERKHLAATGFWMVHDAYVGMRHGPAPLRTFTELHMYARQARLPGASMGIATLLKELAARVSDSELLLAFSKQEIACIEYALSAIQDCTISEVEAKVKGRAWRLAGPDGLLDPLEVAREGGARAAELDFILRWRDPPLNLELSA